MNRPWISCFALAFAAAAGSARGHHSLSSVYDSARQITVEGHVTSFLFVNPHPILVIDVAADGGEPQPWQLEMDNRFELQGIGIAADTFRHGDRVVVTGSASRADTRRLYLRRLDRPADGLRYEQVGSRPRINRRPEAAPTL